MPENMFYGDCVQSRRNLHSPSDWARTNLIYLQEVGQLTAQKQHTSKRKNLDSYLFFVVTEGNGALTYHGVDYPLKQGSCVFLDCHDEYAHSCAGELWSLAWVHFNSANFSKIYAKFIERSNSPVYATIQTSQYIQLLNELYDLSNTQSYIKDMKLYEKMLTLLCLIFEDSYASDLKFASNVPARMLHIKDYLDNHYAENITLDYLSSHFFMNKYYLARSFKASYDTSVINYLLQVRIYHAKQYLRFSEYSINEIASLCGYKDCNYFSRNFKQFEGITPGEYRKTWHVYA